MNWLFANCKPEEDLFFPEFINSLEISVANIQYTLYYDAREWKSPSIYKFEDKTIIISGWFVLNGEKNNLESLFTEIKKLGLKETLNNIELGVFTGVFFDGSDSYMFADYLSLSHHFYTKTKNGVKISPIINYLINEDSIFNEHAQKILNKTGYLLGNDTVYNNINRIPPGCIVNLSDYKEEVYFHFNNSNQIKVEYIPVVIKDIISLWDKRYRNIALSSGFDSRLIYACGDFKYVYTFGPEKSYDRKSALKLFKIKNDIDSRYDGFNFAENEAPDYLKKLNKILFEGAATVPFEDKFIASFYHAFTHSENEYVTFDGFLGDALQRGTLLHIKNRISKLLKTFPILNKNYLTSNKLIISRYGKEVGNSYVLPLYEHFLNIYNLKDSINSYLLFEIMYGRNTRYIINGATVLKGINNISVPVFAHRIVFETLILQDFVDTISYKTFKKLWRNIPKSIKKVPSEMLYSVMTPRFFIPFFIFIGRIVTFKISAFYNYANEHKLKN